MVSIIEESIEYLQNICLPKQEFYFVLASLLVYLNQPLSDEPWNVFKKKIINKEISIENALFMSHEEKNPGVFKYGKKTELVRSIDMMILRIKRDLEKKFPNLYKKNKSDVVCIPDVIKSYDEPTFFSKKYIENQIRNSDYTNKLTGHPFSWEFVESIKTNSVTNIVPNNNEINRKTSLENIIKYVKKELDNLHKTTKYCMICKKKKVEHKSVQNYRFVYFCSLECMDKWNID